MNTNIIIFSGIAIVLLVAGTIYIAIQNDGGIPPPTPEILSFEDCVAAGNPVMESYPRQCRARGQTFVEDIGNEDILNIQPQEKQEGQGSVSIPSPTPIPVTQQQNVESKSPVKTYAHKVINENPLVLSGNDILEIIDTHYIQKNNVILKDNAKLIIRNSLFEHEKDYTFQYGLTANDNSQVIVENSDIANNCTGSLNWGFFQNASMVSTNVGQQKCNIWHLFANNSKATIQNHLFNGTFCDNAIGDIRDSHNMEIELCFPDGAVVDETLPTTVSNFVFPNENEQGITTSLHIQNSTIDGWGINVAPQSNITIRNSPRITTGIHIAPPWENQTVTLDDLVAISITSYPPPAK